jgi:iduronate 2-sulfatase
MGCFSDPHAKTPHMDRLAQRGVTFLSSYTQQAVCAPSRHALMTGYRPDQLGIYDLGTRFRSVRPDAVTLSQAFIKAGWYAEGMGKIFHVGHGNNNDVASWSIPHWTPKGDAPAFAEGGPAMPPGTKEAPVPAGDKKRGSPWGWPDVADNVCYDGKTAEHAAERLSVLAKEKKPFFLGVGFSRPHLPFIAPKRYWDMFDPATLPVFPVDADLPEQAPKFTGHTWGELRKYGGIQEGPTPLTEAQARVMVHGYYAATAFVDAQIGMVLDAIDNNGLADNTIIVLWGDHG